MSRRKHCDSLTSLSRSLQLYILISEPFISQLLLQSWYLQAEISQPKQLSVRTCLLIMDWNILKGLTESTELKWLQPNLEIVSKSIDKHRW